MLNSYVQRREKIDLGNSHQHWYLAELMADLRVVTTSVLFRDSYHGAHDQTLGATSPVHRR